jgi:CubicO group peptidase (beta-lactamase class C family)
MKPLMTVAAFALLSFARPAIAQTAPLPSPPAIDAEVQRVMGATGAKGLAMAIVDHGQATYVHTWGARNAAGDPLTPQTVMYGASVTKAVFAWTVMQMAQEGVVDLDKPIADYLSKPCPTTTMRIWPTGTPTIATSPPIRAGARSPRACC